MSIMCPGRIRLFFFNDTATTEIYTLSLHDALPISFEHSDKESSAHERKASEEDDEQDQVRHDGHPPCRTWSDRKSTRLNSSHANISYAVFCLKKKNSSRPIPDLVRSDHRRLERTTT